MKKYKLTLLVDQGWYQELAKISQYTEDGETFQWLEVEEQD
jgi:hypothetical protein